MANKHTFSSAQKTRSRILALAGTVLLLFLTACGAKVDTVLTISAEGVGTRDITLTYAKPESSELPFTGGIDGIRESIERHIPDEIQLISITEDDSEIKVDFEIVFESIEEYTVKTKALLAAGGLQWSETNQYTVEQGALINGVAIREDFGSTNLLAWLENGFVADGVVAASDKSNILESGVTTVVFGENKETTDSRIEFNAIKDLGFDDLIMVTDISTLPITRQISYHIEDRAQYIANQDIYDEFFASLTTSGISITPLEHEIGKAWQADLSGDQNEIRDATDAALMSEVSVFAIHTAPNGSDPLTIESKLTNYAECKAICSSDFERISDQIHLPEGTTLIGGSFHMTDGLVDFPFYTDNLPVEFSYSAKIQNVILEMNVEPEGPVELVASFHVSADDAAMAGEGLLEVVSGESDLPVEASEDVSTTIYTVSITGDTASTFAEEYSKWAGRDSLFTEIEGENQSLFTSHYLYDVNLFLPLGIENNITNDLLSELRITFTGSETIVTESVLPAESVVDGNQISVKFETSARAWVALEGGNSTGIFLLGGVAAFLLVVIAGSILILRARGKSREPEPADMSITQ